MNSSIDILFLRRPALDYVSPPICEVEFSSSASPVIVLEDIERLRGPSGLVLGGSGGFRLSWDAYPGALCYSIYRAVDEIDPFSEYTLVAECISDNFVDLDTYGPGVYRVTAITPDGESEPSDPIIFGLSSECGCPDEVFSICPDDLTGLIGWYAADCLELIDGAEVETWEDKAASMGDADKIINPGPIFKENIFGALPAVHFTGSQELVVPFCPTFGDFTILAVTQCPSQITILGNPSTGDYYLRTVAHSIDGNAAELFQGSSSRATREALTTITNGSGLTGVRREDVFLAQTGQHNENLVFNPALPVLYDTGNFRFTRIGGTAGFAYASNDGYLAELCVWNRRLTNQEITDLFTGYFQLKYAL